ncbi:MAG: FkbM family methyltransferase [Flavobacteriales bacterium]|nr:FkbM family methyltransferase [Flavobacteriales bacterium]
MKTIYNIFRSTLRFIIEAKRSNYSIREKLEVFKVLWLCYVKGIFGSNNKVVTQKIFGFTVHAYSYRTLHYLFKEIFVTQEYNFIVSKESPKIIDCGANIGMAILYFKKRYPNAHIRAFEPNPHVFELLEKNVKINGLENVELFNLCLSNEEGEMEFYMNEDHGTLVGSLKQARGGNAKISVKSKKLSSLIDSEEIDLIKMDIEGAEKEVISDLIANDKLKIVHRFIIEYHHRLGSEKSKLAEFIKPFEDLGLEYNLRTDFNQIGELQDILIDFHRG